MGDTGFNGTRVEWKTHEIKSLVNVHHVITTESRQVEVCCNDAVAENYPPNQNGTLEIFWASGSKDGSMAFARIKRSEVKTALDCPVRTYITFEDTSDQPAG